MRGKRLRLLTYLASLVMIVPVVSCSTTPDNEKASETFADCLDRNGVIAEGVEVTVGSNGKVEGISLRILSEGDIGYEPALRLSCTEEVELNQ
ncbi:MAG: hypothetical protein WBM90_12730 [Acidimicrobiia bacterium]